jgi:type II secretory pathway pseudopilin PulG
LIEIMVVVVLIGILTATIIPEMRGSYADALLRSTSRDLISAFSLASSRAASAGQVYRVRIDRSNGRYFIEKRLHEDNPDGEFVSAKDIIENEGQLDTRISIQIHKSGDAADDASEPLAEPEAANESPVRDRDEAVIFYPDSTAEAAEVRLRDAEGFRLGLRLNPVTARVHIVELGRE